MADNTNEPGDRASKESIPLIAEAEAVVIPKPFKTDKVTIPKPISAENKRQLLTSGEATRRVRGKGKTADDSNDDKKFNRPQADDSSTLSRLKQRLKFYLVPFLISNFPFYVQFFGIGLGIRELRKDMVLKDK
ncbi:hypothetical protein F66182_8651 [Fusarium sp. NRRL 66182]|nr:hypothetical protein F66182_8651 [Fusarium sp. NRRL 66182]